MQNKDIQLSDMTNEEEEQGSAGPEKGLLRKRTQAQTRRRTDTKKPRSVSASGLQLRRRLPTLPLAQYHRRDEA